MPFIDSSTKLLLHGEELQIEWSEATGETGENLSTERLQRQGAGRQNLKGVMNLWQF